MALIKHVVARHYTKKEGIECDRLFYVSSPIDAYGIQDFTTDVRKAFLFDVDDSRYSSCKVSGIDRTGSYEYSQEVIEATVIIPVYPFIIIN